MQSRLPLFNTQSKHVILLTLFLLGFFDCIAFSFIRGFHYIISYGLLFILFLYRKESFIYSKYIHVYLLFFLFSCIYSQFYNGQLLFKTLGFSHPYLGICFSYYILHTRISYKEIEKILVCLSILYCIGYIIQWLVYPFPLFRAADNDALYLERSYRIRIAGSLCAYMLFFYGLNMFILKKKFIYLIYSVLAFIPIIIMGFRSLTVLSVLLAFSMVIFMRKGIIKSIVYLILGVGIAIAAFQTSLVQDKVEEMMSRQENNQTFDNPDYIRNIQYTYFTEDFFTKPGEQFWGGGAPAGSTKYGEALRHGEEYFHLYWVDWGLVGLTWIIGIPAVLLLIFMYLYCAWRCKDPHLQFIRFTLILLVVGSLFTTKELYRTGNTILASFLFCLEYLYNKENKKSTTQPTLRI